MHQKTKSYSVPKINASDLSGCFKKRAQIYNKT